MRYKVGDRLVPIREKVTEGFPSIIIVDRIDEKILEIENCYYQTETDDFSYYLTMEMIDHEATAKLQGGNMNLSDIKQVLCIKDVMNESSGLSFFTRGKIYDVEVVGSDLSTRDDNGQFKYLLHGEDFFKENFTTDLSYSGDNVNHPTHYTQGKFETIDIIRVITSGYSGFEGSLVGNVTKYISRAPYKGIKLQDLKKAQWYLNKLIEVQGDE